jgi:hypothetical protein
MSKASVLAPIVLERSTLPIIIHRLSSLREKEKEQERENLPQPLWPYLFIDRLLYTSGS